MPAVRDIGCNIEASSWMHAMQGTSTACKSPGGLSWWWVLSQKEVFEAAWYVHFSNGYLSVLHLNTHKRRPLRRQPSSQNCLPLLVWLSQPSSSYATQHNISATTWDVRYEHGPRLFISIFPRLSPFPFASVKGFMLRLFSCRNTKQKHCQSPFRPIKPVLHIA